MSMIQADGLTFSYPGSPDPVFENASFQIDTGWRLGLTGRNGRGKTTLLRLLMGEYPHEGSLISSESFDYFPSPVPEPERLTAEVLEDLCPEAESWRFPKELGLLGVEEEALWRPFSTLSNGERTKALLAVLFLREGRLPLIDEPTNHLDAHGRELVSAYLRRQRGFILVSHDRRFLDGCVDHILALNKANIEVQSGNFSSWALNFERRQAFETAQNELLQKDISRLQKAARKTSDWSNKTEAAKYGNGPVDRGYIGHKSAKMMQRSKAIKARQQKAIEQKSGLLKNVETAESLKLFPRSYHAETLASFSDVEIFYGKTAACAPVSFSILQGDRLVLDGRNGSGKSSLLKLLVGEELKYTGTVMIGSGLIISYVPQNTSHLQGRLHSFAAEHHIDESLFKAVLRKMDFERIQFEKDISNFSEGQKKKVLIAKSLCEQAHLYVWDEPLNFIDIYSRIQIEQLIKEFSPAMIFVEHDKAFRDGISTKIISL